MAALDTLRMATIAVWLGVAFYSLPAVGSILAGRARQNDPMRLLSFLFALVSTGFSVRWLLIGDDKASWAAMYLLSILVGLYALKIARSYGRGDRLE